MKNLPKAQKEIESFMAQINFWEMTKGLTISEIEQLKSSLKRIAECAVRDVINNINNSI